MRKRLFAAISAAILSFPAFADDGSASYELSQADHRRVGSTESKRDISTAPRAVEPAYWAGPTSAIGSHDVGGTDPRHLHGDAKSGDATVGRSSDGNRQARPLVGPTSPIGSEEVGGTGRS